MIIADYKRDLTRLATRSEIAEHHEGAALRVARDNGRNPPENWDERCAVPTIREAIHASVELRAREFAQTGPPLRLGEAGAWLRYRRSR